MIRGRAVMIVLTLLLGACGFLKRSQSEFYSLERIGPQQPIVAFNGAPIGIDVVELPPGLDRREVVVRQENQRLAIREKEQWSASLEPLVLHTLAFDLASRLPEGAVILPGQSKPVSPMQSLDVVFEEFIAGPGNEITLSARWILRQNGRADLTHHERFTTETESLDSAHIATAMSRALATLADRIAARIATVPR